MIGMNLLASSAARFDQEDCLRQPIEHRLAEAADSLALRLLKERFEREGLGLESVIGSRPTS
jgi:hypothetical protein